MTSIALLITTICLCISIHLTNKRISDLYYKFKRFEGDTHFSFNIINRNLETLNKRTWTLVKEEPKKPGRKKKEAKN